MARLDTCGVGIGEKERERTLVRNSISAANTVEETLFLPRLSQGTGSVSEIGL